MYLYRLNIQAEDSFKCNHGTRTVTKFQNEDNGKLCAVQRINCYEHRISGECVSYIGTRKDTLETVFLTEWCTEIGMEKVDSIREQLNRAFAKAKANKHENLSKYLGQDVSYSKKGKLTISIVQEFIQGSTLSTLFLKHSIPCGNLFLQHIAVGCLRAIQHLHANNLTCNGLDASQVYFDNKGDIKISMFHLIGLADRIVAKNGGAFNKANDILSFGILMKALVNGNADAKDIPSSVTGNLLSFIKRCLQTENIANATELLQHSFINKDHYDYDWARQDSGIQLAELGDVNSSLYPIKQIGKGNFGRVFLMKNSADQKQYALKLISLQDDDEKNKTIIKEVVTLSGLIHVNIVRYFNSGIKGSDNEKKVTLYTDSASNSNQDNNISKDDKISIVFKDDADHNCADVDAYNSSEYSTSTTSRKRSSSSSCNDLTSPGRELFILMEYCEKTLRTVINEELYLDLGRVWRLLREMLNGLMYIHRQNLIHRDLKPDNIFLDSHDHVKIGDFGLATRRIRKDQNVNPECNMSQTNEKEILPVGYQTMTEGVGTPLYLAPELSIENVKAKYDNKSDMYSLGIIFFEMCYKFNTEMERRITLSKFQSNGAKLPADFCTDCDDAEAKRDIIESLLNHDPTSRPTCEELLQREQLRDESDSQRQKLIDNIFSKPNSTDYNYLLNACFKQSHSNEVKSSWHTLPPKNVHSLHDTMLVMDFIREKLKDIFKLHGYHNLTSPIFLLDYKYWNNCCNMQLMTQNGLIVSVPFDSRLPFAQYIGKIPLTSLRRFAIERVFREEEMRMPREYYECTYDVVSSTPDSIYDIEILGILCQIVKAIPVMDCGKLRLTLNHTELVNAMLQSHGINVKYLSYRSISRMEKSADLYKAFEKDYSMDSIDDLLLAVPEYSKLQISKILNDVKEIFKGLQHFNRNFFDVVFNLKFLKNISQYSGMMYRLQISRNDLEDNPIILAEGGRYDRLIADHSKDQQKHVVGMTVFLEKIVNTTLQWKTQLKNVKCSEMLTNLDVLICSLNDEEQRNATLETKIEVLKHLLDKKIRCRLLNISNISNLQKVCVDLKVGYAVIICSDLNIPPSRNSNEHITTRFDVIIHATYPQEIKGAINKISKGKYNRKIEILCIIIIAVFQSLQRLHNMRKNMHILLPLTKQDWDDIIPLLNQCKSNIYVDSTSQYDAIRAYLKELDVTNNVWIGLSRNAEKINFKWTDFRPLSSVNNYWQEALPTGKEALCAAMDPAADFRWHALPCGGPSVAAFICELPVPSRATGPDGCLPTGLPSLTVVYKPETGALVLTSDCGKNVTKTVYCKGDANRDAIVRLLTCNNSNEDFDDSSTSSSNTQQDSSVSLSSVTTIHPNAISIKTTNSWSSNTIGSNEIESPTRHRRETEDTMGPTSTQSTTQSIAMKQRSSRTGTPSVIDLVTIVISSTSELNHLDTSTENAGVNKPSEPSTADKVSISTVEDQGDVYVSSTSSTDMKSGSDLTNIDGGDYQSAINQGQLFSIIENGGMFDIIDLNETNEENKTIKSSEHPPTGTTDGGSSLYTTVMYHKEPPSDANVATSTFKESSKAKTLMVTTSFPQKDLHKVKTINDLSSQRDDKTLNKEVEMFPIVPAGNPYAKLNRTNRKELPMMEYIEQENEHINLDINNDLNAAENPTITAAPVSQKEVVPINAQHQTIEIHIHKDAESKETVSTLFVTTKHRDKPEITKKSTTAKPDIIPSTTTTQGVRIDPKIDLLNAAKAQDNTTAVQESEVISLVSNIADRIKEISSEEIMKDQLPIPDNVGSHVSVHQGEAGGDSSDKSGEDESLQKPNRQRQLTRPQRRSFYPYFFSRVLG